jgi:hypothetical protein
MNDVMKEKCLQECEINHSFKQKVAKIQKMKNKQLKKIEKICLFKKQIWKAHDKNSLCWGFFFV